MAVYTDVAAEDLAEFLKGYDIGELLSYKGIAEGVENSNFLLHTSKGAYILTLYEKRVAVDDLPYFLSLMAHLAERGVHCPQPAKNRQGEVYSQLAGRPAAIINFLEGMWPRRPNAAHCTGVGEALAKMHLAGARLSAVPEKSAVGRRLAAAVRTVGAARRQRAAGLARFHRPRTRSPRGELAQRTCRSASSMAICSTTTSSSSATNCPG